MIPTEMITGPLAHHGEGPVWAARDESLYRVDMLAGDVVQLAAQGAIIRHHLDPDERRRL